MNCSICSSSLRLTQKGAEREMQNDCRTPHTAIKRSQYVAEELHYLLVIILYGYYRSLPRSTKAAALEST